MSILYNLENFRSGMNISSSNLIEIDTSADVSINASAAPDSMFNHHILDEDVPNI